MSTSPELFERQLAWLADHGYRTLSLEAFEYAMSGRCAPPAKSVMITFDDGFDDLGTVAAPLLRMHGFTAVAFLITGWCSDAQATSNHYAADGRVEAGRRLESVVSPSVGKPITWRTVREIAAEGTISFQSHTHSHVEWDSGASARELLRADLLVSLETIAAELRLPKGSFRHIAWPWGRCNPEWERIAASLGFDHQYIVQRGAVTRTDTSIRLPRICMDGASRNSFAAWLPILASAGGSRLVNRTFGLIRAHRHGIGYL